MRMAEYLTDRGNWLFRWRSFTPLLLVPLLWLEKGAFHYPMGSHDWDLAYEFTCFTVALAGLLVRVKTIGHVPKGTSGRNSKSQKASVLNTTGMYSAVRNPLYLGNCLVLLGITLMTQSWELVLINSLLFALAYLPIILREEEFLMEQFGRAYQEYAASVPCLIPKLNLWRAPDLPFNLRTVLRREHDTWISTVAAFVFLEYLREYVISQELAIDWPWTLLGASGVVIWLILKMLKKHTTLLVEQLPHC